MFTRTLVVPISLSAVLAGLGASSLGLALPIPGLGFRAQNAAPIEAIDFAPGVTAEVFVGAPSARALGQTLYLAHFVFQAERVPVGTAKRRGTSAS